MKWSLSAVSDSATPRTVALQVPPSMGFSRQEYWSGLPFPSPGDLPDPGIKHGFPALEADALTSEPPGKPTFVESSGFKTKSTLEAIHTLIQWINWSLKAKWLSLPSRAVTEPESFVSWPDSQYALLLPSLAELLIYLLQFKCKPYKEPYLFTHRLAFC